MRNLYDTVDEAFDTGWPGWEDGISPGRKNMIIEEIVKAMIGVVEEQGP